MEPIFSSGAFSRKRSYRARSDRPRATILTGVTSEKQRRESTNLPKRACAGSARAERTRRLEEAGGRRQCGGERAVHGGPHKEAAAALLATAADGALAINRGCLAKSELDPAVHGVEPWAQAVVRCGQVRRDGLCNPRSRATSGRRVGGAPSARIASASRSIARVSLSSACTHALRRPPPLRRLPPQTPASRAPPPMARSAR
eukprot:scaffold131341_cov31-Tisochrysis_lutea.AAC.11